MIHPDIQQQTHRIAGQHVQRFSRIATLAIVAQLFNWASAWLLPAVSEFSLLSDNISELYCGCNENRIFSAILFEKPTPVFIQSKV